MLADLPRTEVQPIEALQRYVLSMLYSFLNNDHLAQTVQSQLPCAKSCWRRVFNVASFTTCSNILKPPQDRESLAPS